ncbi:Putative uncharacterized protein [Taphrina deformans PYCC 5710]|uniref:triacylglycerol lipase n=1 Tax=Taphrina deformans (strain PYCC 5710 / ATCC 11124 / CBS 356.35 / IMI 108563 / JCM 9778 / NBRC 8474) TaxID=1097556 RepID=R4XD93_TAPDE|nr:Putative uncharacterized protein [Taphrina deformans PYCC 5710]|eukprot:CCG81298.1 Putative uncharacterized protein [Taphrina deformans PYCC 5710]
MYWDLLALLFPVVFASHQVLLHTENRQTDLTTPFRLSTIYNRGLEEHYRSHKKLDVGKAILSSATLGSLTQVYHINLGTSGNITSLASQSHSDILNYQNDLKASIHNPIHSQRLHSSHDRWVTKEVSLPNITDRGMVLTLAAMTSNAYTAIPHTGEWIDVDDGYNSTGPFGWDDDGLRGHVFASPDNSSVIIAYKGTSLTGGTARKDKRTDNLMFSCCCGRISYLWRTVCDCYQETFTCNMTCLEKELRSPKGYYHAALDIYHNVTHQYPDAQIWTVGHSMGGAVASLVAQTYGLPAITFQAPGEKLAANRLGLPIVPKSLNNGNHSGSDAGFAKNIWAFGHTADPIYMGSCGGITSLCWSGGYAMETHCHSGLECIYDVVTDFGWRQGVNTHRIVNVINDVILKYNNTPTPERSDECVDCFNWNG